MSLSILVVGSGVSGSTIARLFAEHGENVLVIDRKDHIAGNSFDFRDKNGIMIHKYGSHIFHTSDDEVWSFVNRFAQFNSYRHKVRGVIDGKEVPIPFNLDSLHALYPEEDAERLERKLIDTYGYGNKVPILEFQKQNDPDLRNLAQFVYENVFLHYTMKQWGYSPNQVDGAVTARVPVYISRDDGYFQDKYQGIPVHGYTEIIRRMLDHPKITVELGREFRRDDERSFDRIVYTGPIDEYFDYKFGELPYRSERFVFEEIDSEYYQSNAVINYPCSQDFTRIHEYKYYLGDISERTVIAKEYPEPFVKGRNERYYPIPKDDNLALYNRYLKEAGQNGKVCFAGRLGDYRYYDMDKAIRRSMDLFRSIV